MGADQSGVFQQPLAYQYGEPETLHTVCTCLVLIREIRTVRHLAPNPYADVPTKGAGSVWTEICLKHGPIVTVPVNVDGRA